MGQVQRARSRRAKLRGRLLERDDLATDGVPHPRPGLGAARPPAHSLRLERVRCRRLLHLPSLREHELTCPGLLSAWHLYDGRRRLKTLAETGRNRRKEFFKES